MGAVQVIDHTASRYDRAEFVLDINKSYQQQFHNLMQYFTSKGYRADRWAMNEDTRKAVLLTIAGPTTTTIDLTQEVVVLGAPVDIDPQLKDDVLVVLHDHSRDNISVHVDPAVPSGQVWFGSITGNKAPVTTGPTAAPIQVPGDKWKVKLDALTLLHQTKTVLTNRVRNETIKLKQVLIDELLNQITSEIAYRELAPVDSPVHAVDPGDWEAFCKVRDAALAAQVQQAAQAMQNGNLVPGNTINKTLGQQFVDEHLRGGGNPPIVRNDQYVSVTVSEPNDSAIMSVYKQKMQERINIEMDRRILGMMEGGITDPRDFVKITNI